jgi:hypothetical protein
MIQILPITCLPEIRACFALARTDTQMNSPIDGERLATAARALSKVCAK